MHGVERILAILVLTFAAVSPAFCGEVLPSIDEALKTNMASPNDAAVVIGIEDYPDLPNVPNAAWDARAFRSFLVHTRGIPADRVQMVEGGDREQILQALIRAGMTAEEQGTVWVYFSGHGAFSYARDERLLLGSDTSRDSLDWETLGISLTEVQWLTGVNGARVVIILETSYTDVSLMGGTPSIHRRESQRHYPALPEGRAVIWTAAGPAESAVALHRARHGLFTYFAIGALRGWGDGSLDDTRDGLVTLGEAAAYVDKIVPKVPNSSQRPVLQVSAGMERDSALGWVLGPLALERGPDTAALLSTLRKPVGTGGLAEEIARGNPGDVIEYFGYTMNLYAPDQFLATRRTTRSSKGEIRPNGQVKEPFSIGTTEVTQILYEAVMGANPSFFEGADRPVERVSWFDAVLFCNRLSELEGYPPAYVIEGDDVEWDPSSTGYRLPTELEWESAAMAGESGLFAGSDDLEHVGWYLGNSGRETHDVAQKLPNQLGLYDMSGNVWEWVWDPYDSVDALDDTDSDAVPDPDAVAARSLRGGSWLSISRHVAIPRRGGDSPVSRGINLGLRLTRSLAPPETPLDEVSIEDDIPYSSGPSSP